MTKTELATLVQEKAALGRKHLHNAMASRYVTMQSAIKKHGLAAVFSPMPKNTKFRSAVFCINKEGLVAFRPIQGIKVGDTVNEHYRVLEVGSDWLRVQSTITRDKVCISMDKVRSIH